MASDRTTSTRRRFLQGSLALGGLGLLSGCGLPVPPWAASSAAPRIALVHGRDAAAAAPYTEAFRRGLREFGYEEGRDVAIELRFLDATVERSAEVVRELVGLGVAAIVTSNPQFVRAAKAATDTVPIVLAGALEDPVALGYADSFSRPGGNLTGLTFAVRTVTPKRLQLLQEAVPGIRRVGALWDGTFSNQGLGVAQVGEQRLRVDEAAASLGFDVRHYSLQGPDDLEPTFEAMQRDGVDALYVQPTGLTIMLAARIVGLALQHRLPGMYAAKDFTDAGGLMMMGVDQIDLFRRAAGYVHKILEGVAAGELPIEAPTAFEFVLNLKTAQALDLTIPQSIRQQATDIIQ